MFQLEASCEKEEPVPPEGSLEKEESGEKNTDIQNDETAPEEKPALRLYYGQDITGNEDDSVFRKLKDCFTDGYHGEMGRILQPRISSIFKTSTHVLACKVPKDYVSTSRFLVPSYR